MTLMDKLKEMERAVEEFVASGRTDFTKAQDVLRLSRETDQFMVTLWDGKKHVPRK